MLDCASGTADDSGWTIRKGRRGSVAITTPRDLDVEVKSATHIPRIAWKDAFQYIDDLSLKVFLRSGRMYYLYGLNELIDILPVGSTRVETEKKGNTLRATAQGTAQGVTINSETTVDAERNEVQIRLKLSRTKPGRTKLQFQCEVRCDSQKDHQGVALVLPVPKRLAVLRPYDQSDQAIYDQDSHTFFRKTVRLSDGYGVLASARDRKAILFTGSNLRYVSAWTRYRSLPLTRFFYIYGKDVVLDKGEDHTETFTFKLINGVGGTADRNDSIAGIGALIEKQYVTSEKQIRACFTHPQEAVRTKARVIRDGNVLMTEAGSGNLELDVSALADGAYTVTKELRLGEQKYESREELTVLRETYEGFEKKVKEIASFVERFDPDAYPSPEIARLRLDLIKFKLSEIEAYTPFHEVAQIEGLINDAERVIAALERGEAAAIPKKGKLIYANDFSEDTEDFLIFGNGDITFSPGNGMCLDPVGTMNMWTKFPVSGSFVVEFDYFPLKSAKGGTMVQLCGSHPNPISDYDFMCSASWGSMAYYMFGVRCYHFSFSRWGGLANRPARVCNFRKTGKGFYVLSLIPDPITETEKWYHLSFVKDKNHFLFFVDGRLVQEYFDEGHQGPFLDGGRIGIRNWSTYKSYFKNFKIHAIR